MDAICHRCEPVRLQLGRAELLLHRVLLGRALEAEAVVLDSASALLEGAGTTAR